MRRIVGGLLAVTAALAVLPAVPAAAAARRDPRLQPFAATSIWNTPIGRDARYAPAQLRTPAVGVDLVSVVTTTAADPVGPVRPTDCAAAGGTPRRLPASLRLPPSRAPQTLAVVAPDGRTLDAWTAATLCGTWLGGRYAGRTTLDGDGIPRGGTVPGLPGLGGALRGVELTGAVPVRHALAVLVPARYLVAGRRWPAVPPVGTTATTAAGGAPRLGALLALRPGDAARLPVTSAVGRRLVAALRDHGAYVAGVAPGDTVQVRADLEAVVGYSRVTGHPFAADRALRAEVRRIVAALAVVDDNAPEAVGGHGARLAPPAAPPARLAPAPSPTPAPSASPAASSPAAPAGIPAEPVEQVARSGDAPPAVLAGIGALAIALLLIGLRAGRTAVRLFS